MRVRPEHERDWAILEQILKSLRCHYDNPSLNELILCATFETACHRGDSVTMSDLVRMAGVPKASAHRWLKRYVDVGILVTVPHPDDDRRMIIEMTPIGEEFKWNCSEDMRLAVESIRDELAFPI